MVISLNSARTTKEIFDQYTNVPEDYTFSKTVVPIRLATYGGEQLVSRSQGKRLIARFDRFKTVILDFEGVSEIGQAFADEVFRVYSQGHPETEIVPSNMSVSVAQMYERVTSGL